VQEAKKFRGNKRKIQAYIGLGSNEGDRLGYVQQAMQLLKDINGIVVKTTSSLYETEPADAQTSSSGPHPWFVNAVAQIETGLTPLELTEVCHDVENRLLELHRAGSTKAPKGTVLELNILFYGQEVLQSREITIPYPLLHRRAFYLVPLLEIAPDICHPGLDRSVQELHEELAQPEQVVLYGTRMQ
jgi:2-amino-4-hydroxy-6-hydroxymethyldihydropteridine diphosphokinase